MPAGLLPLCPTCLDRVTAWSAAKCPSCGKGSPVGACDGCQKSRAGAVVPESALKEQGGDARFACVDCMEGWLDANSSDAMFNAVLAVAFSLLAVRYPGRVPYQAAITIGLFALSIVAIVVWWRAAALRRAPARHVAPVWRLVGRRIEKAVAKRPAARAR